MLRLIQLRNGNIRKVGVIDEPRIKLLSEFASIYELARAAIDSRVKLSALTNRHGAGESLDYDEVYSGLEQLFAIGISLRFLKEVSKDAMKLANKYQLAATYDAHYLALASRENCEFWTADARLWRIVKADLNWVHCLEECSTADVQS